ncbi:MAG: lipoyl protein ligase domain-containing protein [Verrucomicrobiota bacterium]
MRHPHPGITFGTDMSEEWFWLDASTGDAPGNMAWDEALLEASADLGRPILRSYAWATPAATFGYFQRYADIAAWTPLRPLIRRPTGGGLVPHEADWTYAVIIPPRHPWYSMPAVESYRRAHSWLQRAFAHGGLETRLAPCCDPAGPGQCFVGAEREDLLLQGRKIAGAAQRRNKWGLLIQGSIQPIPPGLARIDWHQAMLRVAENDWGVRWIPWPGTAEALLRRVEELRLRYASKEYNERR